MIKGQVNSTKDNDLCRLVTVLCLLFSVGVSAPDAVPKKRKTAMSKRISNFSFHSKISFRVISPVASSYYSIALYSCSKERHIEFDKSIWYSFDRYH